MPQAMRQSNGTCTANPQVEPQPPFAWEKAIRQSPRIATSKLLFRSRPRRFAKILPQPRRLASDGERGPFDKLIRQRRDPMEHRESVGYQRIFCRQISPIDLSGEFFCKIDHVRDPEQTDATEDIRALDEVLAKIPQHEFLAKRSRGRI